MCNLPELGNIPTEPSQKTVEVLEHLLECLTQVVREGELADGQTCQSA